MKRPLLDQLTKDRAAKRPVALATRLSDGAQAIVYPDGAAGDLAEDRDVVAAARAALAADQSGVHEVGGGQVFVHVYNPALRLIVVGAVHIAQPLARMAAIAGYDVSVVDPRASFATTDRFPGVTLVDEWPDDAMKQLAPDRRTAVVTLTHDPKLDDPALDVALRTDAFYIGALGSRRTHAKRVDRLKELGHGDNVIARIHGPVGLNIGGVSPAEIAVSILGQITEVLHKRDDT
ncbi:MAG: XdhC family protein [Rhodospirillales bacterium]